MEKIPCERFASVAPRLIWATERVWSEQEARAFSGTYDSRENMVWFVHSGSITVGDRRVAAGKWMFMGMGRQVRAFEGPVRFFSVGLRWLWPDGRALYDIPEPRVVDGGRLPELLTRMQQVVRNCAEAVGEDARLLVYFPADLGTHARLHEIAGCWAKGYADAMEVLGIAPFLGALSDPRLEPVHAMLSGWPLDLPLDPAALVTCSGLSARQLHRLFQEQIGRSPREVFELRRYEHVRRELLQPTVRIKAVAASVGFTDPAAFNRWFTRRSGVPPRRFRAMFAS